MNSESLLGQTRINDRGELASISGHRHVAEYTVRAPVAECFTDSKGFYRLSGSSLPF